MPTTSLLNIHLYTFDIHVRKLGRSLLAVIDVDIKTEGCIASFDTFYTDIMNHTQCSQLCTFYFRILLYFDHVTVNTTIWLPSSTFQRRLKFKTMQRN